VGVTCTTRWVHETLKVTKPHARTLVRLARELDKGELLVTHAALTQGLISLEQAQAIAEAASQLPAGEVVQVQPEMVEILHVGKGCGRHRGSRFGGLAGRRGQPGHPRWEWG